MHAKRKQLDPATKQVLTVIGAVEAGLKIAALIDLAVRSRTTVVGGRKRWVVALLTVNSFGLLPIVYFLRGRR